MLYHKKFQIILIACNLVWVNLIQCSFFRKIKVSHYLAEIVEFFRTEVQYRVYSVSIPALGGTLNGSVSEFLNENADHEAQPYILEQSSLYIVNCRSLQIKWFQSKTKFLESRAIQYYRRKFHPVSLPSLILQTIVNSGRAAKAPSPRLVTGIQLHPVTKILIPSIASFYCVLQSILKNTLDSLLAR